jgi:hypothetical protein
MDPLSASIHTILRRHARRLTAMRVARCVRTGLYVGAAGSVVLGGVMLVATWVGMSSWGRFRFVGLPLAAGVLSALAVGLSRRATVREAARQLDRQGDLGQRLTTVIELERAGEASVFLPMLRRQALEAVQVVPHRSLVRPLLEVGFILLLSAWGVWAAMLPPKARSGLDPWPVVQQRMAHELGAAGRSLARAPALAVPAGQMESLGAALARNELTPEQALQQVQAVQEELRAALARGEAGVTLMRVSGDGAGVDLSSPAGRAQAAATLRDVARSGHVDAALAGLLERAAAAADAGDDEAYAALARQIAEQLPPARPDAMNALAESLHALEQARRQLDTGGPAVATMPPTSQPTAAAAPPQWQRVYVPPGTIVPADEPGRETPSPARGTTPALPQDAAWLAARRRAEQSLQSGRVPPEYQLLVRRYFADAE